MQPWRGRDAAKAHMFSSHLKDKLLGGADLTAQYDFTGVGGWCDRVPGGTGTSVSMKFSFQ